MADPDPVPDLDLLPDPDAVPAPLSCAVADAGSIAPASSLRCLTRTLTGPGPAVTRLAMCAPRSGSSRSLPPARFARKPRAGLAPWRPQPCGLRRPPATGLVQHLLTHVLRDLFVWPPQKSQKAALLRRPAPRPPKGALSGPPNITRGDYAHWSCATLPRASLGGTGPESGCARIIRVMFSGPRQRT